jgi:hypothetical protein
VPKATVNMCYHFWCTKRGDKRPECWGRQGAGRVGDVGHVQTSLDGDVTEGSQFSVTCSIGAGSTGVAVVLLVQDTLSVPGGVLLLILIFRWYGMVWYGMVWYGMVWYGMVWYGMVWYGMVWYGMVWYGMVWYGMVWYGMVWYGMVWYGMVWYGMVWYGMVWYGMVWYGMGASFSK